MDPERAAIEEWEQNWTPTAREPNSQMKDDTKIPQLYYALEKNKKWIRDLFPWIWETKTSWRPPNENVSMHEKFQRSATGLSKQLEQIQNSRINRDNITGWASNLRFLTGPESTVKDDVIMNPLPTEQMCKCTCSWEESVERGREIQLAHCSCASATSPFVLDSKEFRLIQETPNCRHYIAVSYRWRVIIDDTRFAFESRGSDTRKVTEHLSTVIDRATNFALYHGYRLLWIDQKCIIQSDMIDKTIGVQGMDLVYENASLCLAVIECEVTSQEQIDALTKAIDVNIHPIANESEWRKWIKYLDYNELIAIAEVVKMIVEDDYFSRAWIAQENTAANATILLIRCDSTLLRPDFMGSLDGEIQLPLCEFRVACAKLAGAFEGCRFIGHDGGSLISAWTSTNYGNDGANNTDTATLLSTILSQVGEAQIGLMRQTVEMSNLDTSMYKPFGSNATMYITIPKMGDGEWGWFSVFGLLLVSALLGVVRTLRGYEMVDWEMQDPLKILESTLDDGKIGETARLKFDGKIRVLPVGQKGGAA